MQWVDNLKWNYSKRWATIERGYFNNNTGRYKIYKKLRQLWINEAEPLVSIFL